MPIFEVKGRQFEFAIVFPVPEANDIFELFFSKENIENTFKH